MSPACHRFVLGFGLAFALSCVALVVRAEVPDHNPSLDHQCPKGFQYSRGPAACKQADCPPGAGRTYTYDCSCGEAWDKPFRTCYKDQLATHCVAAGESCATPEQVKAAGGLMGILGGTILISTARIALSGSGPVGWGLLIGGAAVGYGIWLWRRGKAPKFVLGAKLQAKEMMPFVNKARTAVESFNTKMKGGLNDEELKDLRIIYERFINMDPAARKELQDQMLQEGVDMVKLGDAVRWYSSLPEHQK